MEHDNHDKNTADLHVAKHGMLVRGCNSKPPSRYLGRPRVERIGSDEGRAPQKKAPTIATPLSPCDVRQLRKPYATRICLVNFLAPQMNRKHHGRLLSQDKAALSPNPEIRIEKRISES